MWWKLESAQRGDFIFGLAKNTKRFFREFHGFVDLKNFSCGRSKRKTIKRFLFVNVVDRKTKSFEEIGPSRSRSSEFNAVNLEQWIECIELKLRGLHTSIKETFQKSKINSPFENCILCYNIISSDCVKIMSLNNYCRTLTKLIKHRSNQFAKVNNCGIFQQIKFPPLTIYPTKVLLPKHARTLSTNFLIKLL